MQRDIGTVDLLSLLGGGFRRVASTNGGEYAGPCPLCGGRDRFRIWPNHPSGRGRWWCRQCGRRGDAVDFLREHDGLSFRQALERLGLQDYRVRGQKRDPVGASQRAAVATAAERPTWDPDAAQAIIEECEAVLWSPAGERARAWLYKRLLRDGTLRAWRIGYNQADRRLHGLYVPRGIVIPCFVGGEVQYLKVRRPVPGVPGPKYQQVAGSKAALFGLDALRGHFAVVVAEAELDALLLHQEAGDLVDVVATGSKSLHPALPWLARLSGAVRWLVALDSDADDAATWWGVFSARVRRVCPPTGNDITEFAQAGGDLRAWVQYMLAGAEINGGQAVSLAPEADTEPEAAQVAPATQEAQQVIPATSEPDPLVLRAVAELGAVCVTGFYEAQAEVLLAQADGSPEWARRWATLAEAAGWNCEGTTWAMWADETAREAREQQKPAVSPAIQALPSDRGPCFACRGRRFWQRWDGAWICARCHPPVAEGVPEIVLPDG